MSFTIVITTESGTKIVDMTATETIRAPAAKEVYRQTVEDLDLLSVINTINRKKRVRRAPIKTKPE